jgi:hypothetical protein
MRAHPFTIPPLPERTADEHILFLRECGRLDEAEALAEYMLNSHVRRVLFHGTTHDFDSFDTERAHAESFYGRGIYLTTSPADASVNYAGKGPDLEQRINLLAERLESDWTSDEPPEELGERWEQMTPQEISDYAQQVAEAELHGQRPGVLPVFARVENPVIIEPRGGTWLGYEFEDDPELVARIESLQAEREKLHAQYMATEDEAALAAMLEALSALDERIGELEDEQNDFRYDREPTGAGAGIVDIVRSMDPDYHGLADIEGHLSTITQLMFDGCTAKEVDDELRKIFQFAYDYDSNEHCCGEAAARVWRELGFDAIIHDAYSDFGRNRFGRAMEALEFGDRHVIVFDPRNVKSAVGCRTFDPRSKSLTDADVQPVRHWTVPAVEQVAADHPTARSHPRTPARPRR